MTTIEARTTTFQFFNNNDYINELNDTNVMQNLKSSAMHQTEYQSVIKPSHYEKVLKSFELLEGSICENYFDTSYSDEDVDFVNDYAANHKNGIILIMNNEMSREEINYLSFHLKEKLHTVIYYKGDINYFKTNYTPNTCFIRTISLKAAVSEAYRKAIDGQAILFPKVDQNFDFFRYIDSLN